ncbi:TonB-dependent receptor domain-containing protein [Croceicoccus sp. BE223]|uniref:TonB-dependent receptor domain-containing protein n=1 Tax=Croceicoccus sp. BE223 TaxID=2817716 RepID=UPI0028627FEC|nr:TonB-dependent receptor [Croceicoccus sp. BE223]MDR7102738.1 outer membrane receptor protein involved in Fe transport [Croceicoccus sp. BE223]
MAQVSLMAIASLTLAAPASAQDATDDSVVEPTDNEIVVTAARIRGQVDVPQAPVAVYDEDEIATFGASSLADLIEQIAPQTSSARGRGGGGGPAFLVNGRRINGFREMRNYPPEAIRRVEVLPEEVALRFGFSPDQRVVNFILKENFSSLTADVEYGFPTGGGYATNEQEVSLLRIDGAQRINIALEAEDSSMLTEAERGVSSISAIPLPGDAAQADYRSLVADSRDLQLNGSWSRTLGEGGTGGEISASATLTRSDSLSLRGLDAAVLTDEEGNSAYRTLYDPTAGFGARVRDTRSEGFEIGTAYNRRLGDWQLTGTANWAHDESRTLTDASVDTDALRDAVAAGTVAYNAQAADLLATGLVGARETYRATSNTEAVDSLVTLTGNPFTLPAGEVSVVLKAGAKWNEIDSRDSRSTDFDTRLSRTSGTGGFTLGLPIASRRADVLSAIGDLSLDLSGGVREVSDFGTLMNGSAGLTWGVTRNLDLSASYIYNEEAPSLTQLGAPRIVTGGSTVYDFATGQTVLVDLLSGGNPDLVAERQSDWKFALNWDVPVLDRSRIIAEYYDEHSSNVSSSFPVLTPAIEAAFPDRVVRDAAGNLVSIDQRPVTFAETSGKRLRYGFDISDRIKGQETGERGEGRGGGGRGGGRGGPGGMPGMGGPGGDGGRWNLALYHTVRFEQDVLISDVGPRLDLLDGDALTGSATPRHQVEMQGGLFKDGVGLRLSGNYFGASSIEGSGAAGSSSLDFHPYATFDARLFVDLERKFEDVKFLKGSRLSLRVDNIFNAQQRVTDEFGTVPISYQPDFLDPKGRFFEIDFRKRF